MQTIEVVVQDFALLKRLKTKVKEDKSMAQYNRYQSYDFERFEPVVVSTSSAAPKIDKKTQIKPKLELVKKPKKSKVQIKKEEQTATKKAQKILAIALAILLFMAMVIYSRVQLDEINRDIGNIETKMELAQSDSIRLNNELNAIVSINNVEDFAVNSLGMVKVQDYQVVYVDLSTDDRIVMANGETTGIKQTNN